jgi:hypothetical protein
VEAKWFGDGEKGGGKQRGEWSAPSSHCPLYIFWRRCWVR